MAGLDIDSIYNDKDRVQRESYVKKFTKVKWALRLSRKH